VKARYIEKTNYGENVYRDERGRSVRFIPSRLGDNPHVNPEYAADLRALPEQLRAAFLDGNWDVFAGQMFPELSRERHVVEPFALPESWRRYTATDWGYSAPFGTLWAAVDEDGRAWFYREAYGAQIGEADQAKRILAAEAEGEHVSARFADDAMFATRGDARPISAIYAENGVRLTPAGKGARVPGWQRVRTYLAEAPACLHHRALGWETCPMLHMFSTLGDFYRTLSDLPHATKGDPEDADTDAEDHLPDCARYLLINLGGGAEQWIQWARRKALEAQAREAEAARLPGVKEARALPAPGLDIGNINSADGGQPAAEPGAGDDEPLEGVPLDPVTARKLARDAAWREQGWRFGAGTGDRALLPLAVAKSRRPGSPRPARRRHRPGVGRSDSSLPVLGNGTPVSLVQEVAPGDVAAGEPQRLES
jgi:hypothetical protein